MDLGHRNARVIVTGSAANIGRGIALGFATEGARVVFGPATRPLPQLPIGVDSQGFLIATGPFQEPVGPSFWERS